MGGFFDWFSRLASETWQSLVLWGKSNLLKTSESELLRHISNRFDKIDTTGQGFINRSQLEAYARENPEVQNNPAFSVLKDRMDELMFANVDPRAAAWHGLSQYDLNTLLDRVQRGESLNQAAENLRAQIIRDRDLERRGGFDAHVRENQSLSRTNPGMYDRVQPLSPQTAGTAKPSSSAIASQKPDNRHGQVAATKPPASPLLQQPSIPANHEWSALDHVSRHFQAIDTESTGFISPRQIEDYLAKNPQFRNNQAFNTLQKRMNELMFANIDPTAKAWRGLSLYDINTLRDRVNRGENLTQIAENLKTQISRDRKLEGQGAFDRHVQYHQENAQKNPSLYDHVPGSPPAGLDTGKTQQFVTTDTTEPTEADNWRNPTPAYTADTAESKNPVYAYAPYESNASDPMRV